MNFLTPNPPTYLTEFGTSSNNLASQIRKAMQPHGATRERRINEIASERGTDPTITAQAYDFSDEVPLTTNLQMLNHCGVYPLSPEDVMIGGDWRGHFLFVADALAALNVYLIRSNPLTDEQCYRRVWEILHQEIKFLPPSAGVNEFIDMTPDSTDFNETTAGYNRDITLPKPASY